MNIPKYTAYSDFISFIISITGLVFSLYLWEYSKNYKLTYEAYKLAAIILFSILFECISLLYAIIRCVGRSEHKRLLTVNIIFSISAILILSLVYQIIFLFFA